MKSKVGDNVASRMDKYQNNNMSRTSRNKKLYEEIYSDTSYSNSIVIDACDEAMDVVQDFVSDNSAPLQQYSELLSHLWDEYRLNSNENICIFLAPQMDSESILQLFQNLNGGEVFRNRFFNADGSINTGCTLKIGLPGKDEFAYMLEYFRLVGLLGKRITFSHSEMPRIISSLLFFSREADRQINRAGYLSAVYENLARYIKNQDGDSINFTESTVKAIYSKFNSDGSDDPLETLTKTKGWENVAKRIREIVVDYKIKKEEFLRKLPITTTPGKLICANERIDTPDDKIKFPYPVPSFILKGHPGVGKTTVARLIGRIFYDAGILERGLTIEATREDLVDRKQDSHKDSGSSRKRFIR